MSCEPTTSVLSLSIYSVTDSLWSKVQEKRRNLIISKEIFAKTSVANGDRMPKTLGGNRNLN